MSAPDTRRSFLERSLLLGAALWPLEGRAISRIKVSASKTPTLAEKELLRGLLALRVSAEVRFESTGEASVPGDRLVVLRIDKTGLAHEESYEILARGSGVIVRCASQRGGA